MARTRVGVSDTQERKDDATQDALHKALQRRMDYFAQYDPFGGEVEIREQVEDFFTDFTKRRK